MKINTESLQNFDTAAGHAVQISLHREDYHRAQAAARKLGYDLASFIKLTVHQKSVEILSKKT